MIRTCAEVLALFAVSVALVFATRSCRNERRFYHQPEARSGTLSSPSGATPDHGQGVASAESVAEPPALLEGAHPPPGTGTFDGDVVTETSSSDADVPGGVYSGVYQFEGLETPEEAVLSTTLDLWNSEAFKTLTLAEVRALLQPEGESPSPSHNRASETTQAGDPLAAYDLSGDGLLLDRIGGLPTEVDVIRGLDSPLVVDALQKFLVADGIAVEFGLRKTTTNEQRERRALAERARDAAQMGLYESLDKASGYKNWALLGAIWRELDK